jgi:hypothetical protein
MTDNLTLAQLDKQKIKRLDIPVWAHDDSNTEWANMKIYNVYPFDENGKKIKQKPGSKPKLSEEQIASVESWAIDAMKIQDQLDKVIAEYINLKVKLHHLRATNAADVLELPMWPVKTAYNRTGFRYRAQVPPNGAKLIEEYNKIHGIEDNAEKIN